MLQSALGRKTVHTMGMESRKGASPMSIKKQYPESAKKFSARMMETLKGAYSNFRPSENPDQLRVYTEALERMVNEFGRGRTAAAIAQAVDLIPDFCPTVAKIR